MNILETQNLSIGYPNHDVANGINLCLQSSGLVCLLGANGVGKSTLLRTLANLQVPLGGTVYLHGKSLDQIPRNELAKQLSIVTTAKIGTSQMTVKELVSLGRYPYTNWYGKTSKEDRRQIQQSMEQCNIQHLAASKLGELSDGQFQKAMLARALAQDTEIILLDEPTVHLDISNRREVFELLSHISSSMGKCIFVSTHELDMALSYADQLVLMKKDESLETGIPEDLLLNKAIEKTFAKKETISSKRQTQAIKKFNIVGEENVKMLVEKALLRKGFGIDPKSEAIHVSLKNDRVLWSLEAEVGETIENLLSLLNK